MNDSFDSSQHDLLAAAGVGKPIGLWIVPAMLVGVVGGLHAVMLGMTGWNLWLKFRPSSTMPFTLTHLLLLLSIQVAGVVLSAIAFRDWARRDSRRAIWTTLAAIALFAAAYGVHLAFVFTYV